MRHQGFPLSIIKVSYTPIVNGLSGLDHAEPRRVTHLCDQISGVKGMACAAVTGADHNLDW